MDETIQKVIESLIIFQHFKYVFNSGPQAWDDIPAYHIYDERLDRESIKVTDPGVIVSPGYPYNYASGELWLWDIEFYQSAYIHLIILNISCNQNQVLCTCADPGDRGSGFYPEKSQKCRVS